MPPHRCLSLPARDLSIFDDASFDLVFHPISNLYARDIAPVWRECFRALRSFYNPVVFVGDRDPRYAEQGLICPRFPLPYSDVEHLDAVALADKPADNWTRASC